MKLEKTSVLGNAGQAMTKGCIGGQLALWATYSMTICLNSAQVEFAEKKVEMLKLCDVTNCTFEDSFGFVLNDQKGIQSPVSRRSTLAIGKPWIGIYY